MKDQFDEKTEDAFNKIFSATSIEFKKVNDDAVINGLGICQASFKDGVVSFEHVARDKIFNIGE